MREQIGEVGVDPGEVEWVDDHRLRGAAMRPLTRPGVSEARAQLVRGGGESASSG